ncbi:hypothetical protein EPO33_05050 [Patescibacteria group bacterium]|nr:MAG: hypothetical protein EPO33_05050 [Patescibacteria group bacterium]
MFDLALLLSPAFWFSIRWNPLQPNTAILMAVAFGLLAAVGALLPRIVARGRQIPKFERKAWAGVGRPAVAAGVMGMFFTFCAYQQVAILSARFWFLLVAVAFIAAEARAIRTLVQETPRLKDDAATRAAAAKYLPGKNA